MGLRIFRLVFILMLFCLVTACIDAAVTGAQLAYNHTKIQNNISDQYITTQAGHNLYVASKEFEDTHIDVATFNHEVLLTGQVMTKTQREKAETLVKNISGVTQVYNLTEVTTPTSFLKRVSDAWITGKVKTQLIAMNEIDPDKIKVITENGTVYLMGMVLPEQASIAIDIARNTDGVEKVVKMFTYLHPSKVL